MNSFKLLWYIFCTLFFGTIIISTLLNLYSVYYFNNYTSKFIKELPKAQVGLILGASVRSSKLPSKILFERLEKGAVLYHSGKVRKLLISGDSAGLYYDEVATMKRFLLKRNVPEQNILSDHFGIRTFNSILNAKYHFKLKSLIIVTQDFHLSRALLIANLLDLRAYGYIADRYNKRNVRYFQLREFFARYLAFYDLIRFYLTEKYQLHEL